MYHTTLVTMTRSYLAAAIFTESEQLTDTNGQPIDGSFSIYDFKGQDYDLAKRICAKFIAQAVHEGIAIHDGNAEQAGIDLWLSRNGHGSGFFDRDRTTYGGPANNATLQSMAEDLGENYIFINDQGFLSFEFNR